MSKAEWLESLKVGSEVAVTFDNHFRYFTTITVRSGPIVGTASNYSVNIWSGQFCDMPRWSIEPVTPAHRVADLRTRLVLRISEDGLEKVSRADLQTISDILDKYKEATE